MNAYQRDWLPTLPGSLEPGFTYGGCTVKPMSSPPSRTRAAAKPATTSPAVERPAPVHPPWHGTNTPQDRFIPRYDPLADPYCAFVQLPVTQRVLKRVAAAEAGARSRRRSRAQTAHRGVRYAQQLKLHVARSQLLAAVADREKYLAWGRALLRDNPTHRDHDMDAKMLSRVLGKLRSDVLAVLSSLAVSTVEVLEAVKAWREETNQPRLVPLWHQANYLQKMQSDTAFIREDRHRVLEVLEIAPATSKVLPFHDELGSLMGGAIAAVQAPPPTPTPPSVADGGGLWRNATDVRPTLDFTLHRILGTHRAVAPYGASPLRGKSTQQARLFDFE